MEGAMTATEVMSTTRRSFLGRVAFTVFAGVPALKALASPAVAHADTSCVPCTTETCGPAGCYGVYCVDDCYDWGCGGEYCESKFYACTQCHG